jgi:hypothetical protein
MDDATGSAETLDDFAASLSYGERGDLSFKFMPRYSDSEVGDALASLLREVGATLDSGDVGPLIDHFITLQSDAYQRRDIADRFRYDEAPFTLPTRRVADSTVGLLTSSGHFMTGDDPRPFGTDGMDQDESERRIGDFLREAPVLSEIPFDAPDSDLVVRHGGYDVRGARADHNVVLPLDPLLEMHAAGDLGALPSHAYSFVGACAQMPLLKHTGPEWVDRIGEAGIDVLLLVPV